MNKHKLKRELKSLKRFSPDRDGDMNDYSKGDYLKYTDVAAIIQQYLGIDISDPPEIIPEPKPLTPEQIKAHEKFCAAMSEIFKDMPASLYRPYFIPIFQ